MPYVAQADLENLIPADFIVEALDDDADGSADTGAWDQVAAAAARQIDGYLEQRYALPLDTPYPNLVTEAAVVFAAEILYQRRGMHGDKNPFARRADRLRASLADVASGESPLTYATDAGKPSISIISENAGTVPASGNKLNG